MDTSTLLQTIAVAVIVAAATVALVRILNRRRKNAECDNCPIKDNCRRRI